MFKTLVFQPENGFWRVSADTKTCGAPLNTCHFYGSLYYTKLAQNVQWKSNFFWKKISHQDTKAQREFIHEWTRIYTNYLLATEITEVFSRLSVLDKLCSKSKHNSYLVKREAYLAIWCRKDGVIYEKRIAFVHKAKETAFYKLAENYVLFRLGRILYCRVGRLCSRRFGLICLFLTGPGRYL